MIVLTMKKVLLIFYWLFINNLFNTIESYDINFDNHIGVTNYNEQDARLNKSLEIDSETYNSNYLEHNKNTGLLKMNILVMVFVSVIGTILLMGILVFAIYFMYIQKIITFDDKENDIEEVPIYIGEDGLNNVIISSEENGNNNVIISSEENDNNKVTKSLEKKCSNKNTRTLEKNETNKTTKTSEKNRINRTNKTSENNGFNKTTKTLEKNNINKNNKSSEENAFNKVTKTFEKNIFKKFFKTSEEK